MGGCWHQLILTAASCSVWMTETTALEQKTPKGRYHVRKHTERQTPRTTKKREKMNTPKNSLRSKRNQAPKRRHHMWKHRPRRRHTKGKEGNAPKRLRRATCHREK